MTDLFDFDRPPDAYAVVGNPIGHSQSPFIHTCFAAQTGQHMVYEAMCVDEGGFPQALGNFIASGGKGLNVTIPFKQDAWQAVDELSDRARRAGAVNTIHVRLDGSAFGDNTDGVGLVRDLTVNQGFPLEGRRILLLGAGGASRGVVGPLLECRPERLLVANRNVERAERLVEGFRSTAGNTRLEACGLTELRGPAFDLIINATAASLQGEALDLGGDLVSGETFAYDMMYGREPTPFMTWAKEKGAAAVSDGLGMLVEQAAESFLIWRGVRPETGSVIEKVRRRLTGR
ncbi:MAG: shikimate dehydrogenase [Gammaproteobacteria bacterium]|nr:shikimate dehydrogenase [Gammaproteobacteria bacterium]